MCVGEYHQLGSRFFVGTSCFEAGDQSLIQELSRSIVSFVLLALATKHRAKTMQGNW